MEKRQDQEFAPVSNKTYVPAPKLSIPQQILNMKKKGISFELYSEADAQRFLNEHTYYFKLKAYAHNFERYKDPSKHNQYINLDFAYLKDLSTIDALFRKALLSMCVDLEHFLKVKMLSDFNKVDEDGYEIVQAFFKLDPKIEDEINCKANTSTCHNIAEKHQGKWAIWNVVELISFGPFISLYNLFYSRNRFPDPCTDLLYAVKMIRNAAAHNNCLLNQLRAPYSRVIQPTYDLKFLIRKLSSSSAQTVDRYLQHPTIHDFFALLVLYRKIVPEPTRSKGFSELTSLFDGRMVKNKSYYQKNQNLVACYRFVREILTKIEELPD